MKKKIAMLLAATLTFTQVAVVPAAAEELPMEVVQEQEVVQDEGTVDEMEFYADFPVGEEGDAIIQDDTTVPVPVTQELGTVEDESTAKVVAESETELKVEEIEKVSLLSDEGEDLENETYGFDCRYNNSISNGANGAMLPNSEMTITMRLFDDNGYIEDYTLVIEKTEAFNEDLVKVSVDKNDPHNIVVKSNDKLGDCDGIIVKAIIDGEQVFEEGLSISVTQYKLLPETLLDDENNRLNPETNESIDLSNSGIELLKYVSEGQFSTITDTENYTFDVSYAPNDWTRKIVDGATLPKMTRITEDPTWLDVFVEEDRGDDGTYELARIRYYFDSLNNGNGGNSVEDEWHEDDVSEEQSDYQLWIDFENSIGDGAMLPNSQMKITTELVDKNNDYAPVTDYKLKIENKSNFGEMTVDKDGQTLIIESSDKIGIGCCYVSVQVSNGNGEYQEVFKKDISFEVSQYMLSPQKLMDEEENPLNPERGSCIDLSKLGIELRKYDSEGNYITLSDSEKYKIEIATGMDEDGEEWFDYDTAGWRMESVEGETLPKLTRITADYTWFTVTAYEKDEDNDWNPITSLKYHFASLSNGGNNNIGYELQIDFDPSENGDMMPNSHLKVNTSLYKIEDEIYMTDYKLEILDQPQNSIAQLTDNDKNLDIISRNVFGSDEIYVSVKLLDENGQYNEIFRKYIPFTVNKYKLSPATFANLKVGESIDLSKAGFKLMEYKSGEGLVEVNDPNIKFIIFSGEGEPGDIFSDYDENGWTLTPVEGQDLPIMTRTTRKLTYFAVMAWDETKPDGDKQLARTMYFFAPVEEHTHNWKEGEVTKKATCQETGIRVDTCECGETKEVTIPVKAHTKVTDAAVAATCTMPGKTEGSHCSDCKTVFVEQKAIPVKEHTKVTDAAVAATCETAGKTEGSHCSVCNKVIVEQETVPAKGHTEVTDAAVAATCEETGKTEGSHCSVCNKVLVKQETVPAKGHTAVTDTAVAATALTEGKTEGSHCSVCGTVLKKQNAVEKLAPTIALTTSSLKMKTGQSTTKFKATDFAEGDYVTKVVSDNTKIVKVSKVKKDGTFKLTAGKKAGTTKVTVLLASGKSAAFKVKVQKSEVKTDKITTTTKKLTLKKGKTYKKLASSIVVTPITSKEKITYTSSDEKIATVNDKGVIKAVGEGTAEITVASGEEEVIVTVKVTDVKTKKLSGVPATKKIARGKTFTIKAVASPEDTNEKITYKSSNKKIATVTSKGVVKGIKKGTVTITVQSGSKKKVCKVTVK